MLALVPDFLTLQFCRETRDRQSVWCAVEICAYSFYGRGSCVISALEVQQLVDGFSGVLDGEPLHFICGDPYKIAISVLPTRGLGDFHASVSIDSSAGSARTGFNVRSSDIERFSEVLNRVWNASSSDVVELSAEDT